MESKTLHTIQTVSKVAKIVCTVGFVCCIVSGILCVLGLFCVGIPESFKLGGVTVHSLLENTSGYTAGTAYASLASGVIMCMAMSVVFKLAARYFTNELDAGTPFTFDGARELFKLGICTICIPLGAVVAASICQAIIGKYFADVVNVDMNGSGYVAFGVSFLFISLLCKHGAEVSGGQQ